MKRETIIHAWSPYSRKKIRRQRLQTTVIATLVCAAAVIGAASAFGIVVMELHSSLQIVL